MSTVAPNPLSTAPGIPWWRPLADFFKNPVVYHTCFWVCYFAFNVLRWGSYHDDYAYAIKANLIEFPLHMALAYSNMYYFIPKLIPKKIGTYLLVMTVGVGLVVLGRMFFESTFNVYPDAPPYIGFMYVLELAVGEIYVQAFIATFKFLLDWGKNQKRTRKLEKRNYQTELAFLRSQIQPHFFFNTLNNLYSLTLDKSDLAPETVLKLSELMSYVIYDGKQKKVHVSKEVSYIQNYLDLERLRFGDKLDTEFRISGDITNQQITPLLLLPFIENSFKHGAGDNMNTIEITILLTVEEHQLTFMVQNKKADNISSKSSDPYRHIGHNGVGVENIKRRLKLIYGDEYQLNIKDEPERYTVTLSIPTYENTLSYS
jgi:sensor histidine kinase YesM